MKKYKWTRRIWSKDLWDQSQIKKGWTKM